MKPRTKPLARVSQKRRAELHPFARSTITPSRKRPKSVNATRKATRWTLAFHSPERVEWVNAMGCCVPGCTNGEIQNSHIRARGAGGTYRDIVPHCLAHHDEWHRQKRIVWRGVTYPKLYFQLRAALVQTAWLRRDEGPAFEQ